MRNKRKFIVVSERIVIDGTVREAGDVVTLDYNDPQVRGWQHGGNLRLVATKKKGTK